MQSPTLGATWVNMNLVLNSFVRSRFGGSDPSSDEVVFMKILDVLWILILSKVGLLTNKIICEIMQSTLR